MHSAVGTLYISKNSFPFSQNISLGSGNILYAMRLLSELYCKIFFTIVFYSRISLFPSNFVKQIS